jgi:hypothetical protein
MPYPDADTLRRAQIDPDTFPTQAECERLGLDPDLLAQAWRMNSADLSEWLDGLDDDQFTAARRVEVYLLLDDDQYADVTDKA